MRQFGLRCVIAPSFGAIFHNNCFRNGVLPVAIAPETARKIGDVAHSGTLALDHRPPDLHGAPSR